MSLTPEQRELRKTGVTGTLIPKVAGLSPFGGPMDAYMECLGLTEFTGNEATQWGQDQEAIVARWYARKTGHAIVEPPRRTRYHEKERWIVASCDYEVNGAQWLLEIKTAAWSRDWGEPGTDEVPDHVLAQCTWQMIVWDVKRVDVCAAVGGKPPQIYTIERDDEFAELLIEKGRSFWFEHVVPRVPPPLDGSPAARDYLAKRYPTNTSDMITPDKWLDDDVKLYMETRTIADNCVQEAERQKQRICEKIGEAAGIQGADYSVTWKRTADGKHTDWEAAFRELATVYGLVGDGFRELLKIAGDEHDQKYGELTTPAEVIAHHTTTRPGVRRFLARKTEE